MPRRVRQTSVSSVRRGALRSGREPWRHGCPAGSQRRHPPAAHRGNARCAPATRAGHSSSVGGAHRQAAHRARGSPPRRTCDPLPRRAQAPAGRRARRVGGAPDGHRPAGGGGHLSIRHICQISGRIGGKPPQIPRGILRCDEWSGGHPSPGSASATGLGVLCPSCCRSQQDGKGRGPSLRSTPLQSPQRLAVSSLQPGPLHSEVALRQEALLWSAEQGDRRAPRQG